MTARPLALPCCHSTPAQQRLASDSMPRPPAVSWLTRSMTLGSEARADFPKPGRAAHRSISWDLPGAPWVARRLVSRPPSCDVGLPVVDSRVTGVEDPRRGPE